MKLSDLIGKDAGAVPASSPSEKTRRKKTKAAYLQRCINARDFLSGHNIENTEVTIDSGFRFDLAECPFCHNEGAALFADADGNCSGYHCFHNSCTEKHLWEFVCFYDPSAYNVPDKLKPDDLTDAGNAQSFLAHHYGEDLLWCDALGWLRWTGQYWKRDDQSGLAAALAFSDDMLSEARTGAEAAQAEAALLEADANASEQARNAADRRLASAIEYLSHAERTRGKARLEAIAALSIPALARPVDAFDADPFCLCTPAGEYDLRTGELHPARRESLCTRITAVSPSVEGGEMWNDFLHKLTCNDASLESYLQYVAGMSLIGKVYKEGLVLGYGSGSNGKSSFFNALQYALGEYGSSIDVKVLTTQKGKNIGPALATLRGKRLVIAAESDENDRLSLSVIKQVTSRDDIVGEEKFKAPMKFKPSHTLTMYTNFLPRIGSTDEGSWRRIAVVPFKASFKGSSDDKTFSERLQTEAGGAALGWAIIGAVKFVKAGFNLPECQAVLDATSEYREDSDWLGRFLEENITTGPGFSLGARVLYLQYTSWAEDVGESFIRPEPQFRREMLSRGFKSEHRRTGTVWLGIKLAGITDDLNWSRNSTEGPVRPEELTCPPELLSYVQDLKKDPDLTLQDNFRDGKVKRRWGEFLRWCESQGNFTDVASRVPYKLFRDMIAWEIGAVVEKSGGDEYFRIPQGTLIPVDVETPY